MSKFSNIKKYFFNYYLILFFIALTLRIFFHLFSPIDFFPDSISYIKLSNLIFTSTKMEDDLAMPGYPIFLFLSNRIFFNYFTLDIFHGRREQSRRISQETRRHAPDGGSQPRILALSLVSGPNGNRD